MNDTLTDQAISALRPTQMTVGMAEVRWKRLEWEQLSSKHVKARYLPGWSGSSP